MGDTVSQAWSLTKDVAGIGGIASGAMAAKSIFEKKPAMPDYAPAQNAANAEADKARQDAAQAEQDAEAKRRLIRSGNYGRRSLFSNGEEGFARTLGGG